MARSYQDLLASAREQVPEVQVPDLASRRSSGDSPLVIDVREQHEWDEGHIPGAIHIPRSFLESRIAGVATPDQEVILSCASGHRSLLAGTTLREMGYSNVESLAGGFQRWKQSGQDYDGARDPHAGPALALLPPRPDPRDRRGRPAQAARLQGAPDRRRRPRIAGGLLPGRGRGGHARPGRRRRRRREQPAAADHPHHRPRRHEQGRVGARGHRGAEPGRDGQRPPVPGR